MLSVQVSVVHLPFPHFVLVFLVELAEGDLDAVELAEGDADAEREPPREGELRDLVDRRAAHAVEERVEPANGRA